MMFVVFLWWILLRASLAEHDFTADVKSSINTTADGHKLYKQLLGKLFDDYNPSLPPNAGDLNQPVDINLTMNIDSLSDLDMQAQMLTLYLWLEVEWHDPGLVWDRSVYPVDRVVVSEKQVWRPVLVVDNSVSSKDQLRKVELPVMLQTGGRLRWFPGDTVTVECPVDLRYYPFDQQTCPITISQWTQFESDVNCTEKNIRHVVRTSGNGEWSNHGHGRRAEDSASVRLPPSGWCTTS